MISQILKENVEEYYYRVKDTNPLFVNARNGKLTEKNVSSYLNNVLYLIRHTPVYLSYAQGKARERKMEPLAVFFGSKLREEDGHDKWAMNDLEHLKEKFGVTPQKDLSPHILELVDFLKVTIEKDPNLYVAYIFLAEYFTILLGPSWLNDLETQCGIPKSMMTVIGNHAELDKEHVKEDIIQMDALLVKVKKPELFVSVLQKAIQLHENFCKEVGKV